MSDREESAGCSQGEDVTEAIIAEYAAIVAERLHWAQEGYEPWRPVYRMGAKTALERVATRIGVPDLHERARAAAARQAGGEEQRGP